MASLARDAKTLTTLVQRIHASKRMANASVASTEATNVKRSDFPKLNLIKFKINCFL